MPAGAGGGIEMYLAKYLLSIEEFMDTEKGEALMERAFLCVDETRRRKAEGMRPGQARAASLGAGLALQLAVGEACAFRGRDGRSLAGCEMNSGMNDNGDSGMNGNMDSGVNGSSGKDAGGDESGAAEGQEAEDNGKRGMTGRDESGRKTNSGAAGAASIWGLRQYCAARLLAYLEKEPHVSLTYKYGENGKPYFQDLPFYFNLSHSGDYVFCVLSTEEIGADIQRQGGKNTGKLAGRFYSPQEAAAIAQAKEAGEKLFYRLWARKEAYGKLTGKGVAAVLKEDLMTSRAEFLCDGRVTLPRITDLPDGSRLIWEECDMEDYSIAVCRYG